MSEFRAHLNGASINGGFIAGGYTKLTFPSVVFACDYAGGRWSPPPGRVVLGGQVWLVSGATGNPANYVAKIVKNVVGTNPTVQDPGVDIITGIGTAGTFPDSFVIQIPGGIDMAVAGDVYGLYLFTTNGACVVDGNAAHTWWSAALLP